jgi:hypothetical protein
MGKGKDKEDRVFGNFEDYLKYAAQRLEAAGLVPLVTSDVVLAAAAMYVGHRLEALIKLTEDGKKPKEGG